MADLFNDALTIATSNAGEMTLWTEDKKKEYVALFTERAADSRYIMQKTASLILSRAYKRKFVGNKMVQDLNQKYWAGEGWNGCGDVKYTGKRDRATLTEIAQTRADELIKQLPSMKKAMAILDPDTAKDMEDIVPLQTEYEEVSAEVSARPTQVTLDDWPETATRLEIQTDIREQEQRNKALLEKQNELAALIHKLQLRIDKVLINGIPGIRDEIKKAVVQLVEQSHGIDNLSRRVEEQVLFGESDTALEMLRHFQKDEAHVSEDITLKFNAGLEKLKLIQAKKAKKA